MIRDKYLDISKITTDKKILKIFEAVHRHGGILRFVGGSVRDAIAGRMGHDLNLSTDLTPDELAEACEDAGIKTTPIGLKYGTLGLVINNTLLEISSLRKTVKDDGTRSMFEFTDNWETDASRRDLTINAVYADEQGNVFDYYDGIADLEKGIVRFIGDANSRIKEDYLRILRFFRFHSLFAKTEIDKKSLKACIENREGLETLSIERIKEELIRIIMTPNAADVLEIMGNHEILLNWLPKSENLENLAFLIRLENALNLPQNYLRRFFVMYFPDKNLAENLAMRLHMTKRQKENMVKWADIKIGIENIAEPKLRRKLIYRYGKDFCIDKLLIESAKTQIVPDNLIGLIKEIEEEVVPIFPISGKDIIKIKETDNSQIGAILDKLKEDWIASDFNLSRDDLLQKI